MKTIKNSFLAIIIAVALVMGSLVCPELNVMRDETVKASAATAIDENTYSWSTRLTATA